MAYVHFRSPVNIGEFGSVFGNSVSDDDLLCIEFDDGSKLYVACATPWGIASMQDRGWKAWRPVPDLLPENLRHLLDEWKAHSLLAIDARTGYVGRRLQLYVQMDGERLERLILSEVVISSIYPASKKTLGEPSESNFKFHSKVNHYPKPY